MRRLSTNPYAHSSSLVGSAGIDERRKRTCRCHGVRAVHSHTVRNNSESGRPSPWIVFSVVDACHMSSGPTRHSTQVLFIIIIFRLANLFPREQAPTWIPTGTPAFTSTTKGAGVSREILFLYKHYHEEHSTREEKVDSCDPQIRKTIHEV